MTTPVLIRRRIEDIAKAQMSSQDWDQVREWIVAHLPNAEDGALMVDILIDRIEELESR